MENDTLTKFSLQNFDKQLFLVQNTLKIYYFILVTSIKK